MVWDIDPKVTATRPTGTGKPTIYREVTATRLPAVLGAGTPNGVL